MRSHRYLLSVVIGATLVACSDAESTSGLSEPLRALDGQFYVGKLPGEAPSKDAVDAGEDDSAGPSITVITGSPQIVRLQRGPVTLAGRASDDGYSIAVRFKDLGTGYWVKPLGDADSDYPGELSWQINVQFGIDLPIGAHKLQYVVLDGKGRAGTQQERDVCVVPAFDSSYNVCDPTQPPAAAMISLTWDVDSDLDLIVKTPSGKLVDSDHPATVTTDQKELALDVPGVGALDGDSNADCKIDSIRREDLIWQVSPEHGSYQIYVNLQNACGKQTTHFRVAAYARVRGEEPGTYALAPWGDVTYGEALALDANGGKSLGLYVGSIKFP